MAQHPPAPVLGVEQCRDLPEVGGSSTGQHLLGGKIRILNLAKEVKDQFKKTFSVFLLFENSLNFKICFDKTAKLNGSFQSPKSKDVIGAAATCRRCIASHELFSLHYIVNC